MAISGKSSVNQRENFKMSLASSSLHQRVSGELTYSLTKYFRKTNYVIYVAMFDVRIINHRISSDDNQIMTVVQPDLCRSCDKAKIDERGCIGAPDLIIEIASPSNTKKEMDIKFDLYEENEVKEYWIVNPSDKTILIFKLIEGKYYGKKPLIFDSKTNSSAFPDLKFPVKKIFDAK